MRLHYTLEFSILYAESTWLLFKQSSANFNFLFILSSHDEITILKNIIAIEYMYAFVLILLSSFSSPCTKVMNKY